MLWHSGSKKELPVTDLRDWMRAKTQDEAGSKASTATEQSVPDEVIERLDRLEAKVDRILLMLGRP